MTVRKKSKNELTIRASSVPRVLNCARSIVKPNLAIDHVSDEQRKGSAAHDLISKAIIHNDDPFNLAGSLDLRYADLDKGEIIKYAQNGIGALELLGADFGSISTEVFDYYMFLTGTSDAVDHEKRVIYEFKLGKPKNPWPQPMTYAIIDCAGEYQDYTLHVISLIDGEVSTRHVTAKQLADLYRDLEEYVYEYDTDPASFSERPFVVGEHCGYCPLKLECAAYGANIASASKAIVGSETKTITREKIGELYQQSRLLKKALASYEDTLRAELMFGDIRTSDGMLTLGEVSNRSISDKAAVIEAAQDAGLSQEEIAGAMRLSLTAIETAIGDGAEKGKKAARKKDFAEKLLKIGAVTIKTTEKIMLKRDKKIK